MPFEELKRETPLKGETLDELALKMGVPGENLKNAVNAYNKAIEGTVNHPIIQPPFWAARTSCQFITPWAA